MKYPEGHFIRNTTAARVNHWITGGCFVLLLLSGLSMFHPLLFFLSDLFGGGQWTRAVHPWIGCVLLVSYAGLIVQFWRDNLWSRDDVKWMMKIDRVLLNDEEGVPEVARFNAGQKFVFWSMTLLVPVLFLTGLAIWEVYFFTFTSIEFQRIAVLIHNPLAAIVAILGLGRACLCRVVDQGIHPGDDPGPCHAGLGVAASPQMVPQPGGDRVARADASPCGATAAAEARPVRQGLAAPKGKWQGNPQGGVVAPDAIILPTPATRFLPQRGAAGDAGDRSSAAGLAASHGTARARPTSRRDHAGQPRPTRPRGNRPGGPKPATCRLWPRTGIGARRSGIVLPRCSIIWMVAQCRNRRGRSWPICAAVIWILSRRWLTDFSAMG